MGKELYELPKGWVWVTVGEISKHIHYGYTASALQQAVGVKLLRITDIQDNSVNWNSVPYCIIDEEKKYQYLLSEGDLVFARTGATVGKSYLIGKYIPEAVFASYLIRIILLNGVSKQFVFNFFKSNDYWLQIHKGKLGIGQPNVNAQVLSKIRLPLPSIGEQHRIVTKIEELFTQLDAGVELLKKVKAKLKRYRQAVLKAAVEGNLTKEWREANQGKLEPASVLLEHILKQRREKWEAEQLAKMKVQGKTPKDDSWKLKYKEPVAPDTSDLPELPDGWIWITLPQIGELNRGKSKHRPRNDPKLYGGQYPFIQTGDVRNANGVINTYTQTYSEEGLKQSRLWKKGTLCITIAANIAETAILGFDACFPDSIVGFITEPHHCDINWIEFFIRTAKENLERYAPATAQKNINVEILSDLAVPLPSLAEQNKIVEEVELIFSIADQLEKTINANIKRAERLRQTILKQAFEGKLVPQIPNDEPAEKLLERIKAEKANREADKKPKRQSTIKSKQPPKSKTTATQLELKLDD